MEIQPLETITRLGLYDCDLSPDGQAVAGIYREDEGPYLGVWTAVGCRPLLAIELAGPYARPRFAPDGQQLAAVQGGEQVTVWSLPEGRVLFAQDDLGGPAIAAHAFGPGGLSLALGQGSRLSLWSLPEGDLLASLNMVADITALQASPAGRLLAVGLQSGGVAVVEVEKRAIIASLEGGGMAVASLSFHPSQPWLLCAGAHGAHPVGQERRAAPPRARVWDYRRRALVASAPCDGHAVFAGGGHYVASLTANSRALQFWRLQLQPVLAAHIENVAPEWVRDEHGWESRHVSLAATPAGDLLAIAGLTHPLSAVGTLRLFAVQPEPVLAMA